MKKFEEYLVKRIDKNKNYTGLLEYPSYVEIETVNACNARCPMCTINDWNRNYPIMRDNVFNKVSDDLIRNKKHLKRVVMHRDGEPLIDKKLAPRIAKFKDNGINDTSIATNVSLLNEKRSREILEAGLGLIIMSIDSLKKDVFEKIRKRLIFEEVRDNAIKFFELRDKINPKCQVWVRMIRQESNYNEWEDYLNFWKKYASDQDRIYFHNIFNWGNQLENYKPMQESFEPNLPCVALWSLMVIFANGDVPLCNVDYNNKYPTGNIMKNSIKEIWHSKVMNQRREWHLKNKKTNIKLCQGCNVWDEEFGEGYGAVGRADKLVSPEYAKKIPIA